VKPRLTEGAEENVSMHSRKSLERLAKVWATDAASIARNESESSRHLAQGCDLLDAMLKAIEQRDEEIADLRSELRREQEKMSSRFRSQDSH
jgi:hypothetical protein